MTTLEFLREQKNGNSTHLGFQPVHRALQTMSALASPASSFGFKVDGSEDFQQFAHHFPLSPEERSWAGRQLVELSLKRQSLSAPELEEELEFVACELEMELSTMLPGKQKDNYEKLLRLTEQFLWLTHAGLLERVDEVDLALARGGSLAAELEEPLPV